MSSAGKQCDAESRDSASRVRADHLSDVRLAGSSVQVRSLQRPSWKNESKLCLCPVPLNTTVFSEPVKSPWQMESHYPAMTHRGCSTPSRSFCRFLRRNKTTRRLTETGIVWLSTVETHTCLLEKLQIKHTSFTSPAAPTCLLFLSRYTWHSPQRPLHSSCDAWGSRTHSFIHSSIQHSASYTWSTRRKAMSAHAACWCCCKRLCMFVSISDSVDRPVTRRCAGLSTCVLGKLSQDIHKLQTYPRTNVGAGTPGRKRSLPEQYQKHGSPYNWNRLIDRLLVHPTVVHACPSSQSHEAAFYFYHHSIHDRSVEEESFLE